MYGANSLTFAIPNALLGNSGGLVNYAAIVGTMSEATDRVPNGSNGSAPLASVPEPAYYGLLTAALCLAAAAKVRPERRR
jgi:hypothetical protein